MAAEAPLPPIRVLTVTVSDSRKRETDDSGKALDRELTAAGFAVIRHVIVKDEPEYIKDLVRLTATSNQADAIVLTGGTGITPRDNTYEALQSVFEKKIDGFGEAFRRISFDEIGPHAILSRATAGTFNECVVFSLPGSTKAVVLGVRRLIVPVLRHAVDLAMGRSTHTLLDVSVLPPSSSSQLPPSSSR
jgi:molybdenum cofactor biosynthesis protein B